MSRAGKWLIIAIIISLIIVLFRMKAIAPASMLSGVLFLAGVVERIYRVKAAQQMYNASKQHNSGGDGQLSVKEALELLELDEQASEEEVKQAYKRLMKKVHPDHGGSKYFTTKLNEAKKVVLED